MRRRALPAGRIAVLPVTAAITGAALLAGVALAGPAAARPASRPPSSLRAGQVLRPGDRLVSADGHYRALVTRRTGRLIVETTGGHRVWQTPATVPGAYLAVGSRGSVVLKTAHAVRWATNTTGSGRADVLTLRNTGVLALTAGSALAWSSRIGNGCGAASGRTILVDISAQFARFCAGHQQLRTSPVTTGATAKGDGTPTGRFRIYARVRNTVLYPAAGGAYPVKYWMPYNGAYGLHDSPWQHFPYGSPLYRTRGSHGCVHVPGPTMAWLFGWAVVGTAVDITG